jgi:hypothetical protein
MKNFLAVFNVLPSILSAVQAVEAAVPLPSAGKQKLDLVMGAAGTAWEITQAEQHLSKNTALNAVEAMVNLAVASLNAAGVFKTAKPVSSN